MENNQKNYVFKAIIALNVLVFIVMYVVGKGIHTDTLINFGAKYNYGIVEGQWWRFVTPMFIHLDLMHLLFNMSALLVLSRTLEGIFGTGKLLSIYFVSGVAGVILSFAFNDSISAGASGAIFGLLGAHVTLFLRNRTVYKHIFGMDFLILIAINLGYGLVNTQIDDFGHLGGLIAGVLMAYAVGIQKEKPSFKAVATFVLTLALMAGTIYYGFERYDDSANYYYFKVITMAQEGQGEEAVAVLREAYARFPNSPELLDLIKQLQSAP